MNNEMEHNSEKLESVTVSTEDVFELIHRIEREGGTFDDFLSVIFSQSS